MTMGTLNNELWHVPTELPDDNTNIVVLGPMGFDAFRWYIEEHRIGRYFYDNWYRWAYLDEIIFDGLHDKALYKESMGALAGLKDAFSTIAAQSNDMPNSVRHNGYADIVQEAIDKIQATKTTDIISLTREYCPKEERE